MFPTKILINGESVQTDNRDLRTTEITYDDSVTVYEIDLTFALELITNAFENANVDPLLYLECTNKLHEIMVTDFHPGEPS